jgi:hypothetical protein
MRASCVLLIALALGTGCTKVTYVNPRLPPVGATAEQTGHFFLFGLVGTAIVPAYQACPHGVATVQSKFTLGDEVLGLLTLGIYTPRTYEIVCG